MPGKILGLDISEDAISAVQVTGGLKGYQISACARIRFEGNGALDEALKALLEMAELKSDMCLAGIPGEYVSFRNLQMPFKDPKKIRQTLAFEMESMVPFPIEEVVTDFTIHQQSDQSDILAASVQKTYISECLAALRSHGMDPEVLEIRCVPMISWLLKQEGAPQDGLVLEIGEKRATMILVLKRRIALIRTFSFDGGWAAQVSEVVGQEDTGAGAVERVESAFKSLCAVIRNTLHSFEFQSRKEVRPEKVFFTGTGGHVPVAEKLLSRFLEIPAEEINLAGDKRIRRDENIARIWNPALMDGALALALRDARQDLGFNFRRDEFETKSKYSGLKKELRTVAVFVLLFLALLASDAGVDYYLLKKRYKTLDQKITEVFRQTLPEVTRIVDPVQQMKVRIDELRGSSIAAPGVDGHHTVLDLLKDISQRIPESMEVTVSRMVLDAETVRISGKTDTFNTVDSVKSSLESSPFFSSVTISSANLDRSGKEVQFELKLQRVKS